MRFKFDYTDLLILLILAALLTFIGNAFAVNINVICISDRNFSSRYTQDQKTEFGTVKKYGIGFPED